MAYLVDEAAAERSRNHPTKHRPKRIKPRKAQMLERKLARKPSKANVVKFKGEVPFYETDAWKRLRYEVLRKYGARCQCCGRTRHDNVVIHVDHIKPRSRYPHLELDINNLQVLCEPCNMGKSASDLTDWR